MTYRRIESASDLPTPGFFSKTAREKETLDFKQRACADRGWENAKDIAAFANRLGGVLLIGADEQGHQLSYLGLIGQSFADVKAMFEQAAERLCSPSPVVNVIPVCAHNVELAAVNVDPFVDQLVGSRARSRDQHGRHIVHKTAWIFPVRVASQTQIITPENLPVYMNREVRRAVVLLARIPARSLRKVTIHYHSVDAGNSHRAGIRRLVGLTCALTDVSVERNAVTLEHSPGLQCRVPLLDVQDIWESTEGSWDIRIAGRLIVSGSQFKYLPLPM